MIATVEPKPVIVAYRWRYTAPLTKWYFSTKPPTWINCADVEFQPLYVISEQ